MNVFSTDTLLPRYCTAAYVLSVGLNQYYSPSWASDRVINLAADSHLSNLLMTLLLVDIAVNGTKVIELVNAQVENYFLFLSSVGLVVDRSALYPLTDTTGCSSNVFARFASFQVLMELWPHHSYTNPTCICELCR